jgi:hypothetical protein
MARLLNVNGAENGKSGRPVSVPAAPDAMAAVVRFPVIVVASSRAAAVRVNTPPPANLTTAPDSIRDSNGSTVRDTPDPMLAVPADTTT